MGLELLSKTSSLSVSPAYRHLSDWVVLKVLDGVREGHFTPGQRLTGEELARTFQVSCGFSQSFTQGFSPSFTHPWVLLLTFYQFPSFMAITYASFVRKRGAPAPLRRTAAAARTPSRTRSEARAERRAAGLILDGSRSGGYPSFAWFSG
jgi:hypothetical protein